LELEDCADISTETAEKGQRPEGLPLNNRNSSIATTRNRASRNNDPNGTLPKAVADPKVTNPRRLPNAVIRLRAEYARIDGYARTAAKKPVACATPTLA